eukprot:gene10967-biopygen22851
MCGDISCGTRPFLHTIYRETCPRPGRGHCRVSPAGAHAPQFPGAGVCAGVEQRHHPLRHAGAGERRGGRGQRSGMGQIHNQI